MFTPTEDCKEVEGIFNGQNMIDIEGNEYPISQNYCSKSKLVEGDSMKLYILNDGSFIYKMINKTNHRRAIATIKAVDRLFFAEVGEERYKVLFSSINFFNLKDGDRCTVILPSEITPSWATIECKLI